MRRRFPTRRVGKALTLAVFASASTGVAPAAASPSATAVQASWPDRRARSHAAARSTRRSPSPARPAAQAQRRTSCSCSTSRAAWAPQSSSPNLKTAATDTLTALDAADGATDQSIAGNARGHRLLPGTAATVAAPARLDATARCPQSTACRRRGPSPHDLGINSRGRGARRAAATVREVDGADQRRPGERRRADDANNAATARRRPASASSRSASAPART